ncbi:MAG: AbrB/MazE/SpoVT family DNA-binding domain-containing protein [Candidatus Hodarchaeota archaeon]
MSKEDLIKTIRRSVNVQVSKPKPKEEGGRKGQRTTPQYFIHLPKEVVLALGIKKGDKVIITVPLENKSQYSIKFEKKIK